MSLNQNGLKDSIHYELGFSKSKKTDNYFLNSMKATLENGATKETKSNVFIINQGNDVTAKEAYNLLRGASIMKKAEIPNYFKLKSTDDNGLSVNEVKVKSIEEARNIISDNKDKNVNPFARYELLNKETPIRIFEGTGKNIPIKPEGKLQLVHEYLDKESNQTHKSHYPVTDIDHAKKDIQKIVNENNPLKETKGFHIYDDKPVLFYSFDKKGNETDITPGKRNENIWIKLDFEKADKDNIPFKKFYQNYGFNLENELSKIGVKELQDDKNRNIFLSSLERGNMQKATMGSESVYVEANPQFKKVDLYDRNLNKIQSNELSRKL